MDTNNQTNFKNKVNFINSGNNAAVYTSEYLKDCCAKFNEKNSTNSILEEYTISILLINNNSTIIGKVTMCYNKNNKSISFDNIELASNIDNSSIEKRRVEAFDSALKSAKLQAYNLNKLALENGNSLAVSKIYAGAEMIEEIDITKLITK